MMLKLTWKMRRRPPNRHREQHPRKREQHVQWSQVGKCFGRSQEWREGQHNQDHPAKFIDEAFLSMEFPLSTHVSKVEPFQFQSECETQSFFSWVLHNDTKSISLSYLSNLDMPVAFFPLTWDVPVSLGIFHLFFFLCLKENNWGGRIRGLNANGKNIIKKF